jgi:glycosyltransferase involved in cell wall biosynthesis
VSAPAIRVVMLVDNIHETVGGAERFVVGLASELQAQGHDVTVCTTRQARGAGLDTLRASGVRHLGLDRRSRRDVLRFRRLLGELRAQRPHVLHAHKFGSNLWGTVIGRLARVPVIIAHEHTWSYEGNRLRKLLDGQLIGRLATAFVAVSDADARRMVELEGVRPEKIVTINNAYVPSWHTAAPGWSLREELGLPASAELVGTAAMLRPQKALDQLVTAFGAIAAERPDAPLVIAGGGECRESLEAQAAASRHGDRVHFLGPRDDVDAIVRELDVAAMSSDYEGTPLFAFECFASRTPLVATDVGGLGAIIESGRSGTLVPRRDPDALAAAIIELLRDPERRALYADEAERRLAPYGLSDVAGRFSTLYRRLLADGRGGR